MMAAGYAIEDYRPELAPELVALWNAALGARFPLTARLWRQNVDEDPNRADGDGLIARAGDGAVAGFALTRMLRRDGAAVKGDLAALRDLGWIIGLVVGPEHAGQGLGGRLLGLAEGRLRGRGAMGCDPGGGVGHLLPGPPAGGEEDERALRFWVRHGYRPERRVHDLRRSLADWAPPPPPAALCEGGYRIVPGAPGEEGAVVDFLRRAFPGRWRYEVAEAFARGGAAGDVLLVKDGAGTIEGFLCLWPFDGALLGSGDHWFPALGPRFGAIGPLGVAASVRGRGLGLALVAEGVSELRRRGVEECVIDWTDLLDFYGRLGFRPWRSYWRCAAKPLAPAGGA